MQHMVGSFVDWSFIVGMQFSKAGVSTRYMCWILIYSAISSSFLDVVGSYASVPLQKKLFVFYMDCLVHRFHGAIVSSSCIS